MTQEQGKQALPANSPAWGSAERACCDRLLQLALAEDLGDLGDVTSAALLPETLEGQAAFIVRADGVLAGMPCVQATLHAIDPSLCLQIHMPDGMEVQRGTRLATVAGRMRTMLTAERTALNFLQRLSGVATLTKRYVDAIAGLPCQLLDTRKTTPGWRELEKYAVRCGGGHNHRHGLFDMVLIKDNHLAALKDVADPIGEAIKRAHAKWGNRLPIEVEVDSLAQLEMALAAKPDIVLLDNLGPDLLRQAVARRHAIAPDIKLEASGGVTLATLRDLAATGADYVSVGALTHSAVALDIALDYQLS